MPIAQRIHLRYQAPGHVRFVAPEEICQASVARQIEQGLQRVEGVYRVKLYTRQGKLSIRYHQDATDLKTVARALHSLVSHIELAPRRANPARTDLIRRENPASHPRLVDRIHSGFQAAINRPAGFNPHSRETSGPLMTKEREQFIVDFFTDILVLYLIKLHWNMILNNWLKQPWKYRNEWMATLYMIFLLVRSKKPK